MLAQQNQDNIGSPFAWCVERFDKISGKLVQRDTYYEPVEAEILKNLRWTFDVVVHELGVMSKRDWLTDDVINGLREAVSLMRKAAWEHDADEMIRWQQEAFDTVRALLASQPVLTSAEIEKVAACYEYYEDDPVLVAKLRAGHPAAPAAKAQP